MRRLLSFLIVPLCVVVLSAQSKTTLEIYLIDVEGGNATLFAAPSGESLLIDTGNPGARDTDRIMEVIQSAGVKQIDHMVLTHYHGDHVGGLQELAKRIPIKHFIDHGPPTDPREQVPKLFFERNEDRDVG